jgi:hypothetical protein
VNERVPIGAGKIRKMVTLPEELVARVRRFRFRAELPQESDAYVYLLEKALADIEREQSETAPRRVVGASIRSKEIFESIFDNI